MSWCFSATIGPMSLAVRLSQRDEESAPTPPSRGRPKSTTAFTRSLRFADILPPGTTIAQVDPEAVVEELARLSRELFAESRVKTSQVEWGTLAFAGRPQAIPLDIIQCGWGHPRWGSSETGVAFPLGKRLEQALPFVLLFQSTAEAASWNVERFAPVSHIGADGKLAEHPDLECDAVLTVEASEAIVGWWSEPDAALTSPPRSGSNLKPAVPSASRTGRDLLIGSLRPGTLPLAWPGWGSTVDGLASPYGILQRLHRLLDNEAANELYLAERFRKPRATDGDRTSGAKATASRRKTAAGNSPTEESGRVGPHEGLRTRVRSIHDLIAAAEGGNRLARSLLLDAATVLGWAIAQSLVLLPAGRVVLSGDLFHGDDGNVLSPLLQTLRDELRDANVVVPQVVLEPPLPGGLAEAAIRRIAAVHQERGANPGRPRTELFDVSPDAKTGYLRLSDPSDFADDSD
jgi:hypothetical protein